MKEIKLFKNRVAIVDDEDFEAMNKLKWHFNPYGYAVRSGPKKADGRKDSIRMHRLILNAPPNTVVDHINGNGLDNRKQNLRIATHKENIRNSRLAKNNRTGKIGVSKSKNGWRARIMVDRKGIHLGTFKTIEDAALAYQSAALKYFGEFAPREIKSA